jgi:dinuclear metal center YbgI/SA1388 family protein
MAELADLVRYLDGYLNTAGIVDYPGAYNGLQVESPGKVTRVGAAVDACEAVMLEAAKRGVDLLIVHHGLLWTTQRFTGPLYRKLKRALTGGLAVYSSHLPLDLHPEVGNNAQLAAALELPPGTPAFTFKGQPIGLKIEAAVPRAELARRLEAVLGGRVHLAPGGPETTRRIGIVTGGAGSEVAQALAEGVDTFITGEGPHHTFTLAEEFGLNLFYGGHYATETFGVKALAAHLEARFGLPWEFIDHPTGL